ncbi:hypothetical protein U27_06091 [Candidatus Vecturithrix granuli]|uniref:Uncharacterized protein n=1 Tax=Vecturithrix granuli TaxID=1499967 RepID=A0A081C3G0_VECG1|nr:hypothetical protein U27_06091 [Candidatus Vecturithrix granuli]
MRSPPQGNAQTDAASEMPVRRPRRTPDHTGGNETSLTRSRDEENVQNLMALLTAQGCLIFHILSSQFRSMTGTPHVERSRDAIFDEN